MILVSIYLHVYVCKYMRWSAALLKQRKSSNGSGKCENMRGIAGEAAECFRVGVINKPKIRIKCNSKHVCACLCMYVRV